MFQSRKPARSRNRQLTRSLLIEALAARQMMAADIPMMMGAPDSASVERIQVTPLPMVEVGVNTVAAAEPIVIWTSPDDHGNNNHSASYAPTGQTISGNLETRNDTDRFWI